MNPEFSNDKEASALKKSREGDSRAFGELVLMHQRWLRGYLRTLIRDHPAADDLAQDAFVTAFRKIRDFREGESFAAWLRGIAINLVRNHRRKHIDEPVGDALDVEKLVSRELTELSAPAESLEALEHCLTKMDRASRKLLEERYVNGRTVRELATQSGRHYSSLTMEFFSLREVLLSCMETRLGKDPLA